MFCFGMLVVWLWILVRCFDGEFVLLVMDDEVSDFLQWYLFDFDCRDFCVLWVLFQLLFQGFCLVFFVFLDDFDMFVIQVLYLIVEFEVISFFLGCLMEIDVLYLVVDIGM